MPDTGPEPSSALAGRLVACALDQAVASVSRIPFGVMNWKYQVTSASGEHFIIRFFPTMRSGIVFFEPDLIARCRAHGIAVPEIVTDSRTAQKAPWEYSIYRMLVGVSLDRRWNSMANEKKRDIAGAVTRQMAMIAALPTSGFGELLGASHACSASWRTFIGAAFDNGLSTAQQHQLVAPRTLQDLRSIRDALDCVDMPGQASIAWGDVSPGNIILDAEDGFVGLIDFEGALAAELALNIGYLGARFEGQDFCTLLRAAWHGDDCECIRADLYAIVRALRLLKHGDKPLPLGKPRDPIEKFLPGFLPAIARIRLSLGLR